MTEQDITKSFYFNRNFWILALWQLVNTFYFTAVQILIPSYFDSLSVSQIMASISISIFFFFWFFTGPLAGIASDIYGRKLFLILSNIISSIGVFGLFFFKFDLGLLISTAILGFGNSMAVGSVLALWTVNIPESKIGESMSYYNLILGTGGLFGVVLGGYLYDLVWDLIFLFIFVLVLITGFIVFFVADKKEYEIFDIRKLRNHLFKGSNAKVYMSKPILQIGIHWIFFSAIIGTASFIGPIVNRIADDQIPLTTIYSAVFIFGPPIAICLVFWGWFADNFGNRLTLTIGFSGLLLLAVELVILERTGVLVNFISNLVNFKGLEFLLEMILPMGMIILFLGMGVALMPSSMSWIIERTGKEDLAKVMAIRQSLIGLGTIIGTMLTGVVLDLFPISSYFILIGILLIFSAIILL